MTNVPDWIPPKKIQCDFFPVYRQTNSPVTAFIVGSTVIVFLTQLYFYFIRHSTLPTDWLAFSPLSFSRHSYWQLITYAWLHSVTLPVHIIVNMAMVWVLGCEVERILGSWRFILVYLGGVILAAYAFLFWNELPWEGVEGASGAAFALLTSLAVLCPRRKLGVLLFLVIPMRLSVRMVALIACGIEVICIVFGWLPFISHSAHLGGAFFGAAFTWLIKPRATQINPVVWD